MGYMSNISGITAMVFINRLEKHKVSDKERLAVIELDLSHTKLTELPASIGQLTNLTSLDLSFAKLTELPASIGQLTNLTSLSLSHTNLTELPASIVQLTNLTYLSLRNTNLTELPASIVQLTNLTYLNLSRTNLTELPASIVQLTNLTYLNLSRTNLTELPTSIVQLTNLIILDLRDTTLTELPPQAVISWIKRGLLFTDDIYSDGIIIKGTHLKNQDIDLFRSNDKERILAYCRAALRSRDTKQICNEGRIVFLGNGDAGKTHTRKRLLQYEENTSGEIKTTQTAGVEIEKWKPNGTPYTFHIWDFGGQDILYSLHRCFLNDGCLYVIILRERKEQQMAVALQWLNTINRYGRLSRILIAVNVEKPAFGQVPLYHDLIVDQLRESYPELLKDAPIITYCAVEADGDGFVGFREKLLEEAAKLDSVTREMTAGEYQVKRKIEDYSGNLMSSEEYRRLCGDAGIPEDNQDNLLDWLKSLGVCFKYQSISDYQLLNPNWVTLAAYGIIRQIQTQKPRSGGIDLLHRGNDHGALGHTEILLLLNGNTGIQGYEPDDIKYILNVLRQYKLSFPFGTDKEFFPALCPNAEEGELLRIVSGYEKKMEMELCFKGIRDDDFFTMMVSAETTPGIELDHEHCYSHAFLVKMGKLCATVEHIIKTETVRILIYRQGDEFRPCTLYRILRNKVVAIGDFKKPDEEKIIVERIIDRVQRRIPLNYDSCLQLYSQNKKTYVSYEYKAITEIDLDDIMGLLYNEEEMKYVSERFPNDTKKKLDELLAIAKQSQEALQNLVHNTLENNSLISELISCLGEKEQEFVDEVIAEISKVDKSLSAKFGNKKPNLLDIFSTLGSGIATNAAYDYIKLLPDIAVKYGPLVNSYVMKLFELIIRMAK